MSWFSSFNPRAEAESYDEMRALGQAKQADLSPSWYQMSWDAPIKGIGGGINALALMAGDAALPLQRSAAKEIDKWLGGTSLEDWTVADNKKLHDAVSSLKADQRTNGIIGQAVHGVMKIVPSAVLTGGAMLPVIAGGALGYEEYQDKTHEGLDPGTAMGMGAITALSTWAGLKLPMVGGVNIYNSVAQRAGAALGKTVAPAAPGAAGMLAADVALGAGGNVGLGMLTRGATAAWLRANGHADMAKSYEILDGEAIAVDLIMGGGFGALAHYMHGPQTARELAKDKILPSDQDAALAMNNELVRQVDTTPGIPADMATRAAHLDNLDRAQEALVTGEPFIADEGVTNGNFVRNPQAEMVRLEGARAVLAHLGPDFMAQHQAGIAALKAEFEARGMDTAGLETSTPALSQLDALARLAAEGEPARAPEAAQPVTPEQAIAKATAGVPQDQAIVQSDYDAARAAAELPGENVPAYTSDSAQVAGAPKQSVGVRMFDASQLKTDARRFQFKEGGDDFGVISTLKDVTAWDASKGNQLIVWQAKDGALYVVDGHQRSGLARRLIAQGHERQIMVPGLLYREIDGISDSYVRAKAAAKNIGEGSGSPVDGAKILKEHPELMDGTLSLTKDNARRAINLSRLQGEAWRMVINEVTKPSYAAEVGRLIPNDAERQLAAMKAIVRFHPSNEEQAAILVQRVRESELAKADAKNQTDMFGDLMGVESTAGEEMKIVDRAVKTLAKDKALFARVVANADRIEETGSTVKRDSAQAVASDAQIFEKVLTSEAYSKGPVRDALMDVARKVKDGQVSIEQAAADLVRAVERRAETGLAFRPSDSSGPGGRVEGESVKGADATRPGPDAAGSDAAEQAGLNFEPGADNKPQAVIPGAEQIAVKQQIERMMAKPKKGGNAPMVEGSLWDDGARAQKDLIDLVPVVREALVENPNMEITGPNGKPIPAIKALEDANNKVDQAEIDAKGIEAAANCAIRNGDGGGA